MELILKGDAKEIAALVLAIQEQPCNSEDILIALRKSEKDFYDYVVDALNRRNG